MRIPDCFGRGRHVFSFEFFPPRTPEAELRLFETVAALAPLRPSFVSVTYGAGGSTRRLTVDLVTRIKNDIGIEAMAHLTCAGHDVKELAAVLERLAAAGIENVLALRGDPPRGRTEFQATPGGFAHGSELAAFIRARYDFAIGGAGYPEGHPESSDADEDLGHLLTKVRAGAQFIITQLFFEAPTYFAFLERARAIGADVPIVPGIMPVTNVGQIERFTSMCGASIPAALRERLDRVRDDDASVTEVGIEWATAQCRELLRGGAPGIHFYTLNRSHSAQRILAELRREGLTAPTAR